MRSARSLVSLVLAVVAATFSTLVVATPAEAAVSITSATFTGGASTVTTGGVVYAKQGGALTLTVVTSSDTKCVLVGGTGAGIFSQPRQTDSAGKSSWVFTGTAGAGDGVQGVTVGASPAFNSGSGGSCSGNSATGSASYTLDNTGPVVTGVVDIPASGPNAAGWYNVAAHVTFTGVDAGVGGVTYPDGNGLTVNGGIHTESRTARDSLGNVGTGSLTVQVDRREPTITAVQTQNSDGTTTVTFTCADTFYVPVEWNSGVASCLASGSSTSSKTVTGPATVTGTGTDVAGNTATASVSVAARDTTAPTINGAVSPAPNAAGWNKSDATVTFTCTDNVGVASCVADGTSPASASRTVSTETSGTAVGGTATDTAGNTSKTSVTVRLDKTAPTISATKDRAANGAGWYAADVAVSFACADTLSGVASCPAPKVLGEGADQSAGGTATDLAGNPSAAASVTGINVDKTAPVLTGSYSSGWHTGDVTVTWTCTDALSGVVGGNPAPSTVTGEGSNLTAQASCTDRAGNTTTKTVSGIMIDRTAPTTTVTGNPGVWINEDVTLGFVATDTSGGSGVAAITYTVDGGAPQSGASVTLTTDGDHTVTYFSTDAAGNSEAVNTAHVKIDTSKPTLVGAPTTEPNDDGWYRDDVTVHWTCTDTPSGVLGAPKDDLVTGEGSALSATTECKDGASNSATTTVGPIRIDRTAPTTGISGGSNDWVNGSVTLTLTPSDLLSGVKSTTYVVDGGAAQTGTSIQLATEGDHTITYSSTDKAGNKEAVHTVHVKIDKTAPTINHSFDPDAYIDGAWTNGSVTVTFTCADQGGSGLASCAAPSTVSAEGVAQSVKGTATDGAGNSASDTATVSIDLTKPTITASADRAPNGFGWYGAHVTVSYTCGDALSGVKSCSSADVLGEGKGQKATGTVTDNAGNAASDSVSGVDVDATAPTLSGAASTAWHTGDVTVTWTCHDGLSGIVGPDHSIVGPDRTFTSTITGEGKNLGDSASCTDAADHTSTASVTGVRIDRTKPATTLTADGNKHNGWYVGGVEIKLDGTDNLSGVAATYYTVDGGAQQTYDEEFTLTTDGLHTVSYWSEDVAGNVEAKASETFELDGTAPVVKGVPTTSPNGKGWYNGDVAIDWTCSDATSGIVGPDRSYAAGEQYAFSSVVKGDGSSLSDTRTCADAAGNIGSDTVGGLKIDTAAPTTVAYPDQAAESGWYRKGTTLVLGASDGLSGVDVTRYSVNGGDATTYTTDGIALADDGTFVVTFWSVDDAGNKESATSITLKVDQTPPALTGKATSEPNADGWYDDDVTVAWTCADGTSGIPAGTCPADSILTGEGDDNSATESVDDVAGNHTESTVGGIKIDRTRPVTVGSIPVVPASGWFVGGVKVTLDPSDNLSGVRKTVYSVDGGAEQTWSGPFTVTGEGAHSVSFHSTDRAGNVEDVPAALMFEIDTKAPVTTVTNPMVPDTAWFVTSGIPFSFDATDASSGVAATYYRVDGGAKQTYGEPFTANLSDGAHTITYWSVDVAGNAEAERDFPLSVDTVAPSIQGSQAPAANSFGWNNTDVEVTFSCEDLGSGLRSGVTGCAGDMTLVNEGAGQQVVGDAVDVAGNPSRTTYGPVNIDKTAPTLTGVPAEANGAGWYTGDVTVAWVGDDGLSGLDPATQPADSTVTGEGRDLGASAAMKDKAGNTGTGSVSGLKVDRGAPTITGKATTTPNGAGWYTGEVVVDWTCADPKLADGTDGSGKAFCPTSSLVKGDGAGQSSTSAKPTDVAGNEGAAATVSGINIDGAAPSTTADNQCTATNGWCTGSTADVVLTATDQAGLSGVKELHYRINGGAEQVSAGATKTVSVPLTGSGAGTVEYWAVDKADNKETSNKVALKWDNIAPTVTHTLSPAPNADEWNNSDVTVTFTAKDDDQGSGVASVSAPVTVSTETAGQVVTGTAKDTAGNTGTDSVTVKLDKTKPTITGKVTAGTLGTNGWYVGAVTVGFTCADDRSGVVACPDPVILSANGSNSASGTVFDKAGNSASATVSGIKIDQEKPTLTTAGVNVANGSYPLGTAPKATCTPTDSISGVASCTVTVTGGAANGVGTFVWTAKATDNAGNTTTITGTYAVRYAEIVFLQPINDTAHQVGSSTSMFKAGSTVPVKFQLKDGHDMVVQPATAPDWLTPVKGSATLAPVNETMYAASADSGSDYRYDATAQQWIYNWQTGKAAGNYWRIGVKLDDGLTYYVNIGLR